MKIKSAAIKIEDGRIFEGRNHGDIFMLIKSQSVPRLMSSRGKQGFITDDNKFVDRKEAGRIAFEAGQIDKETDFLFSEDITGDWPWKERE